MLSNADNEWMKFESEDKEYFRYIASLEEMDPPRKKPEGKKPQSRRDIMSRYL